MGVYIVVSTNTSANIEVCEAYAGAEAALGRAWSLATTKDTPQHGWTVANPPEEKLSDGSIRWTFLETSKNFVAVYYRPIETTLLSKRDPLLALRDTVMSIDPTATITPIAPPPPSNVTVVSVPNDKLSMDLPGGWTRDGSAVTLRTVVDDPDDILPYDQLSSSQRKALATARIAKNPGWVMLWDNHIWVQSEALAELKSGVSSLVVDRIVGFEVNLLNDLYQESLAL